MKFLKTIGGIALTGVGLYVGVLGSAFSIWFNIGGGTTPETTSKVALVLGGAATATLGGAYMAYSGITDDGF